MTQPLCLVACGASKRESRQPAWKMYESTLFEKSWTAAMLVGHPHVMSAKHGLLEPTDRIEPYDETLRNYTWGEKVAWAEQMNMPPQYETLILFGGRDYVDPIIHVYSDEYDIVDVFSGTGGNGQQMAVAGDIADRILQHGEIDDTR